MILNVQLVYDLAGIFLAIIALMTLRDKGNPRRVWTALFWGIYAVSFLFGKMIPNTIMGALVLVMVVVAGFGGVRLGSYKEATPEQKAASAKELGSKLFIPSLIIPVVTVIIVLCKNAKIGGKFLFDNSNTTIVALGIASVIALIAAMVLTKEKGLQAVRESRRLVDAVGWAAVLPQLLATLGALFGAAGVGKVISDLVSSAIPVDNRFLVVVAYCVGMALFTMIMGNAFAAFPVMTLGIALPLIINMHHGHAAVLAAIGMFSGYCGTLMTPMAANFNIVPAALLDLPNKNAVIKAQVPTALLLLVCNIFLMYFLVF